MTYQKKAIIIGGSIAGLTTAICLRELGYQPHIFDKSNSLQPNGVAINVFPNAMRVLKHVGIAQKIQEKGNYLNKIIIKNSSGKKLRTTNLSPYSPNTVCIRKTTLQELLMTTCTVCQYHTGHEFKRFEQIDDKVIAYFKNGQSIEGDILIGADGIHSQVRKQIVTGKDELRYSGNTCWRGFVKWDKPFPNTETWGFNQKTMILNTGDGYLGWWFTAEEEPNTSDEPEGVKNKLLRLFKGWHDPIEDIIRQTETIFKKDIYDRPPIKGWSKGNVVLIGNAAHPATPNIGQDGCSAIEDAVVLARCLEKYDTPTLAFQQFEKSRYSRTRSIVNNSRILGAIGQWSNPLAIAFRSLVFQKSSLSSEIQSYIRYFDYDALSVEI